MSSPADHGIEPEAIPEGTLDQDGFADEIPAETDEEHAAAVEAGAPEIEEEAPKEEEAPGTETVTEVEQAAAAVKVPSPTEGLTAQEAREQHEKGLRDELTRTRATGREHLASRDEEIRLLRQELAEAKSGQEPEAGVPRGTEEEPAEEVATPAGFKLKVDEDGNIVFPKEVFDKAAQEATGKKPLTPEETVLQEAQSAFETREAEFIAENPEVNMVAAENVRAAAQHLNLCSEVLAMRTGSNPRGADGWMKLFQQYGMDSQMEEMFPDIGPFDDFLHAVFSTDLYHLERYMRTYVERNGELLGSAPALTSPTPALTSPTPPAGTSDSPPIRRTPASPAPKPIPSARPRSITQQGEGNRGSSVDDIQERWSALDKELTKDPMGFSDQDYVEYEKLTRQLEKAGEIG